MRCWVSRKKSTLEPVVFTEAVGTSFEAVQLHSWPEQPQVVYATTEASLIRAIAEKFKPAGRLPRGHDARVYPLEDPVFDRRIKGARKA